MATGGDSTCGVECFESNGLIVCSQHGCLKPIHARDHFTATHCMTPSSHPTLHNNIRAWAASLDNQAFDQHVARLGRIHHSAGFVEEDTRMHKQEMHVCSECWKVRTLVRRRECGGIVKHLRQKHVTAVAAAIAAHGELSSLYTVETTQQLAALPNGQGVFIVKSEADRCAEMIERQMQVDPRSWFTADVEQSECLMNESDTSMANVLQPDVSKLFGCTAGLSDNDVLDLFSIDNANSVVKFFQHTCVQYVNQIEAQVGKADKPLLQWLKQNQQDEFARLRTLDCSESSSTDGVGDFAILLRDQTRVKYAYVIADLLAIMYRYHLPNVDQKYKQMVDKHLVDRQVYPEIADDLQRTIAVLVDEAATDAGDRDNSVLNSAERAVNDVVYSLFNCYAELGTDNTDMPVVRYLCLRSRCESAKKQRSQGSGEQDAAMDEGQEAESITLYSVPLACDTLTHVAASLKHLGCGSALLMQVQRWEEQRAGQAIRRSTRIQIDQPPPGAARQFDKDIELILSRTLRTAYSAIFDLANIAYKVYARVSAVHNVVVLEAEEGELTTSKVQIGLHVFELRHVRAAVRGFQIEIEAGLMGLLGANVWRLLAAFDYASVKDKLSDKRVGMSLQTHDAFRDLRVKAIKHVGTDVVKMQPLIDRSSANEPALLGIRSEQEAIELRKWIGRAHELIRTTCSFAHLLSAPARGTEIASALASNTGQQIRSLFLLDGRIMTNYAYHKTLSTSRASAVSKVCRFFPRYLTSRFIGVFVVLRAGLVFAHIVNERFRRSADGEGVAEPKFELLQAGSLFVVPNTPAGSEAVRRRFARDMGKQTKGEMTCTFGAYRQFAAAVFEGNLDPTAQLVGEHVALASTAFNHTTQTATRSYAVDSTNSVAFGGANSNELRGSLQASRLAHAVFGMCDIGVLEGPLALPPDLARLMIVPVADDLRWGNRKRLRGHDAESQSIGEGLDSTCTGASVSTPSSAFTAIGSVGDNRVLLQRVATLEASLGLLSSQLGNMFDHVLQTAHWNQHGGHLEDVMRMECQPLPWHELPGDFVQTVATQSGRAAGTGAGNFQFRSPKQALAVCVAAAALEVQDAASKIPHVVYVAGTGTGKSLVFQTAGLIAASKGKTVVVLVPYRALLQQHLLNGRQLLGERCSTWNASLPQERQPAMVVLVMDQFVQDSCLAWISTHASLVVVDEVHVLLQEQLFRSAVAAMPHALGSIKVPLVLLSATLSGQDVSNLSTMIGISAHSWGPARLHVVRETSTVRRDIRLRVVHATDELDATKRVLALVRDETIVQGRLVVVYGSTIAQVTALSQSLMAVAQVQTYVGTMTAMAKDAAYEQIRSGSIKIVCATSAFGVGIDLDIALVLVVGPPTDLGTLVQLIGRAGRRSGVTGTAVLLMWEDIVARMPEMFRSSCVVRDLELMSNEHVCLPAVASHRYDGVAGLICRLSDDYVNCSACELTSVPTSNRSEVAPVARYHSAAATAQQLQLAHASRVQCAAQLAERFWSLIDWALSISKCVVCFKRAMDGRAMLTDHAHKGSCWGCKLNGCSANKCPVKSVTASLTGTCTKCRLPQSLGNVRTHPAPPASIREQRAKEYGQNKEPNQLCGSGMQDYFVGLLRASAEYLHFATTETDAHDEHVQSILRNSYKYDNLNMNGMCKLVVRYLEVSKKKYSLV